MRERVNPEDYKGVYYDEICREDLIIMGEEPEKTAGYIKADKGIYDGLWNISIETGLGLLVDIRRIPMKQEYIDECNRKDINPYEQPVDQKIYIAHPLSEYHLRKDLTVIGYLTETRVCKLINGERESFLNR